MSSGTANHLKSPVLQEKGGQWPIPVTALLREERGRRQGSVEPEGAVLTAWHLFPASVLTCLMLELAYFAHDKLRAI